MVKIKKVPVEKIVYLSESASLKGWREEIDTLIAEHGPEASLEIVHNYYYGECGGIEWKVTYERDETEAEAIKRQIKEAKAKEKAKLDAVKLLERKQKEFDKLKAELEKLTAPTKASSRK